MNLTCKDCGAAVRVDNGSVLRTCGHNEAGIIANMEAATYGRGAASAEAGEDARLVFLRRVLAKLVNWLRGR